MEREQAHRHEVEGRLVTLDEGSTPSFYAGQRRAHYVGLAPGVAYLTVMTVAILYGEALLGAGGAAFGSAAMLWAIRRDPSGPPAPESKDQDETTVEQFAPAD